MPRKAKRSKASGSKGGRSVEQQQAMTRYFKGLPVIDAKEVLRLFGSEIDLRLAKPRDPEACLIAQAARRQCGSQAVLFFRSVAYVDLEQPDGSRAVERFVYGSNGDKGKSLARSIIEAFDKNLPIPRGGISLYPPTKAKQLEYMRVTRKEQMAKRRTALLNGTAKSSKPTPRTHRVVGVTSDALDELAVRSGIGMVHFNPENAQ